MSDLDYQQESEWICKCQNGEKEAFGYLVRRYMRQAYYAALALVGSHPDALDLSQEAFVRSYKAIGRFNPEKSFYSWYYRTLRNLCLNFLRDRSHRAVPLSIAEIDESNEPAETADGADTMIERTEMRKAIWDALWRLEVQERELIVARDMLGTSYEKLAELMDCPLGTVMSRLYHARRKLRETLKHTIEWQT